MVFVTCPRLSGLPLVLEFCETAGPGQPSKCDFEWTFKNVCLQPTKPLSEWPFVARRPGHISLDVCQLQADGLERESGGIYHGKNNSDGIWSQCFPQVLAQQKLCVRPSNLKGGVRVTISQSQRHEQGPQLPGLVRLVNE